MACYVPAIMYDASTTPLMKKLFAAAWLRQPENPYSAAREVEARPGFAVWIAQTWVDDEDVLGECTRLRAALGPIAAVPSKEQFAFEVYSKPCKDDATKLRYLEFFAKLMGYIDEGKGSGVNVNILNQQKVLAVPMGSTDAEWEHIAQEHQKTLQARHG